MTMLRQILGACAIGLVAATAALAQEPAPSTPPPPPGPPPAGAPPPELQHDCLLKTLNACKTDGHCAPLDALKDEKLPVKMTVDLAVGIVAGVGRDGWVEVSRIASVARAGDEIVLQGIDGADAWQLLIDEKGEAMSFALATATGASIGFGSCTVVKQP